MTGTLRFAAAIGLAVGLAAPGGAEVRPGTVVSVYDLYLGGIKAGEMVVGAYVGDEGYRGEAVMQTAGLAGLLYNASFTAGVEGRVVEGGLAPHRFTAESAMEDKEQDVVMTYGADGAPAAVLADPPFVPKPWEIVPQEQHGAIDPLTAAIRAFAPRPPETICNRVEDMYDGRRRYEVELGAPEPHQGRIRCPATYRRVAGFKPKLMRRQAEFPFHVWFEVRADGLAHFKRAAGDSMFGLIVILARE